MLIELERKLKNMPLLTKQNLSLILNKKEASLNYWTKKLVDSGVLIRLKNGLYASSYYIDMISQNPSDKMRYLEYVANQLCFPSYLSLEYVLSKNNVLAETVFKVTSVTLKSTRTYKTPIGTFVYRNIKESLFNGYEIISWRDKQIKEATTKKALADWRYFNKGADLSRVNLNSNHA